ncbi:hypothetical protein BWR19_05425 [Halomonas sp. 1513]|nr:3',5'-cyclic-nucleotide phosphodiesterase [Halomonas sp. 1513]APX92424.1 hypothetical protein BWR19_05425 [Halomonas sp. 1513]
MKINVLGASGGLGAACDTTAIRLGHATLLDAGTGLTRLSVDDIFAIERVFISHAHLDHVAGLPLLVDALFERLSNSDSTLSVYALPEVIKTLQRHLFNQQLWPDFGALPSVQRPVMHFVPLAPGQAVRFDDGEPLAVTAFPVSHRVAACGFRVESADMRFVFSGDTTLDPSLVESFEACGAIDILMQECAFPDRHRALAKQAGHMTPELVSQLLAALSQRPAQLWISHLKPIYRREVMAELESALRGYHWQCL